MVCARLLLTVPVRNKNGVGWLAVGNDREHGIDDLREIGAEQQLQVSPHLDEVLEVGGTTVLVPVLVHKALEHPGLRLQVPQCRLQPLLLPLLGRTILMLHLGRRTRLGSSHVCAVDGLGEKGVEDDAVSLPPCRRRSEGWCLAAAALQETLE